MCKSSLLKQVQNLPDGQLAVYPELYAKGHKIDLLKTSSFNSSFTNSYQLNKLAWNIAQKCNISIPCNFGFISGKCSNGHIFMKSLHCGKEYCKNCGLDGSPTHIRRMARWIFKVDQMKNLGYLVVTIPDELRYLFQNTEYLTGFRTSIIRKLKRLGYSRGLARYHLFGDCHLCSGKGCYDCNTTGKSKKYNPHLNIFIEEGYLTKKVFTKLSDDLKKSIVRYFKKISGKIFSANIFYSYANTIQHKIHKLKYVTRATFRIYNRDISMLLKGYRLNSTFGRWNKPETEDIDDILTPAELIDSSIEATDENIITDDSNTPFTETNELINATLFSKGLCVCCNKLGIKSKIKWDAGNYTVDIETGEIIYVRSRINKNEFDPKLNECLYLGAGYYQLNE